MGMNFPPAPTVGQEVTFGDHVYTWNGYGWTTSAFSDDYVQKAGDTMEGFLALHADPDAAMKAATKQYVDGKVATVDLSSKVSKSGDLMTGGLTLGYADPTLALTKDNVVNKTCQSYISKGSTVQFLLRYSDTDDNFRLYNYDNAGGYLGSSFTVDRLTRNVSVSNDFTASGKITSTAKKNALGNAGGTGSTGALTEADANIILYAGAIGNWAGIGTDGSGNMWFRTGLSGTAASAMYIDTNRRVNVASLGMNGVNLIEQTAGTYTRIYDPSGGSGAGALVLGNASAPTNFYVNDTHRWQSRAAALQATLNTTGLEVQGYVRAGTGATPAVSNSIAAVGASGLINVAVRSGACEGMYFSDATQIIYGSFTNHPVTIRTNNAARLTIDTVGTVSIPGQLNLSANYSMAVGASGSGGWHNSGSGANRFFIGTDGSADTWRVYAVGYGNAMTVTGSGDVNFPKGAMVPTRPAESTGWIANTAYVEDRAYQHAVGQANAYASQRVYKGGDTITGKITQQGGVYTTITYGGSAGSLEIYGAGGSADAMISFHRPGAFGCNFGLVATNSNANHLSYGGWSHGANKFDILSTAGYMMAIMMRQIAEGVEAAEVPEGRASLRSMKTELRDLLKLAAKYFDKVADKEDRACTKPNGQPYDS